MAPAGAASYTGYGPGEQHRPPTATPPNNTAAQVTTTVTPSVDVRTLLSGPASVPVFSPMTYSMTTINDGPSVAPTVVPTLQLPANLTNVVLPSGCHLQQHDWPGDLCDHHEPGQRRSRDEQHQLHDARRGPGDRPRCLGSESGVTDRNVDNNRVSITTTSAAPTDLVADLSATVTSNVASAPAGTTVIFTATYANGPVATSDAASNVRPVLALPAGLDVTTIQVGGVTGTYNAGTGLVTFTGGTASGSTYNFNTGVVTFPVTASLPNSSTGGYAPLVYTVSVTAPGVDPLTATASVSSATSDPTRPITSKPST